MGDTIEVPDGFPSAPDLPEPGEPVVILRELHPNIAWFLGQVVDEGTVVLRPVTSESSEGERLLGFQSCPRCARHASTASFPMA